MSGLRKYEAVVFIQCRCDGVERVVRGVAVQA